MVEEGVEVPMLFSPNASDVKSVLTSQTDLENAPEGLGIFGTVAPELNSDSFAIQNIFNNVHLHYVAPDWTYDYLLYWSKGATYSFVGVYPYSADASTLGSGAVTYGFNQSTYESTISIPVSANWQTPDLMYGFAARDLTSVENYSIVPINLKHAFAALEFKVVNASGITVNSISDVALKNIIIGGTMNAGDMTVATTWTNTTRSAEGTWGGYTRSGAVLSNIPYGNTEYTLYNGAFVVIPQEVVNTTASISFTKVAGDKSDPIEFTLGNVGDIRRWEAGKKYTYLMTLQSTTITFTVTVVDWIENIYNLN